MKPPLPTILRVQQSHDMSLIINPFVFPVSGGGGGGSYRDLILADSPVAYWRLGEASGTAAADEVGSFAGAYVGSPTLAQAGAISGDASMSVTLNGSSQRVGISSAVLSAMPYTLEAWINPATITGFKTILSVGRDHTSRHILYLELNTSRITFNKFINGAFQGRQTATGVVSAGSWQHIVLTHDGTTVTMCHNGAVVAATGTFTAEFPTGVNRTAIGAFVDSNGSFINWFGGGIDEVAIYASALTGAQILAHYNAGIGA